MCHYRSASLEGLLSRVHSVLIRFTPNIDMLPNTHNCQSFIQKCQFCSNLDLSEPKFLHIVNKKVSCFQQGDGSMYRSGSLTKLRQSLQKSSSRLFKAFGRSAASPAGDHAGNSHNLPPSSSMGGSVVYHPSQTNVADFVPDRFRPTWNFDRFRPIFKRFRPIFDRFRPTQISSHFRQISSHF